MLSKETDDAIGIECLEQTNQMSHVVRDKVIVNMKLIHVTFWNICYRLCLMKQLMQSYYLILRITMYKLIDYYEDFVRFRGKT